MPSNLTNLKSEVDKLDVDKLVPAPVDLNKRRDVVKMMLLKNAYIMIKSNILKIRKPDITNLVTNTTVNAKINEFFKKIPSIADLATTAAFNTRTNQIKNKIPNITNLATTSSFTAVENEMLDHSKYITTLEFNKLSAGGLAARLAQTNLASINDVANFVKKIFMIKSKI